MNAKDIKIGEIYTFAGTTQVKVVTEVMNNARTGEFVRVVNLKNNNIISADLKWLSAK